MSYEHVNPLEAVFVMAARSAFQGHQLRVLTQKVLFRAEWEAERSGDGMVMPWFRFYRWNHGPYCAAVSEAENFLASAGMTLGVDGPLTTHGRRVLRDLTADLAAEAWCKSAIDRVSEWSRCYSRMKPKKILEDVYGLSVMTPMGQFTVKSAPMRMNLITPDEFDASNYQGLLDLVRWRLTSSQAELEEEDASPLMDPAEAERFFTQLDSYNK